MKLENIVNDIIRFLIGAITITTTLYLFFMYSSKDISQNSRDIIMFILGALSNALAQIINFYFIDNKKGDK